MRGTSAALLAAVALVACTRHRVSPPAPLTVAFGPVTRAQVTAVADATRVRQVVAVAWLGDEPRRRLRYHPQVGSETRIMYERQTTTPGVAVGTSRVRWTAGLRIEEVTPAGQIRARATVDDTQVSAEAAGKTVTDASRKLLADTSGVAVLVASSRGVVDKAGLSSLLGLSDLIVVLPEEPIGVGARWQVLDLGIERGGLVVNQATMFEVVSFTGERVQLRVVARGEMSPQLIRREVELTSMDLGQNGEVDLDLGGIIPARLVQASEVKIMAHTSQGDMTMPGSARVTASSR